MAHSPGGSNGDDAAFMTSLYALQSSGVVPFTPIITAQPNDFSIAIQYPSASNPDMGRPESIAVDGSGNVFFSDRGAGYITRCCPTGALSFNYNSGGTSGYLAIEPAGSPNTPASNNVWFGGIGDGTPVDELTNAGALKAHTLPSTAPSLPPLSIASATSS